LEKRTWRLGVFRLSVAPWRLFLAPWRLVKLKSDRYFDPDAAAVVVIGLVRVGDADVLDVPDLDRPEGRLRQLRHEVPLLQVLVQLVEQVFALRQNNGMGLHGHPVIPLQ